MCFLQRCGVSLVLSYAVCFLQRGGVSLASSAIIYNIVKAKVTRLTHRPVDLLEKEPLNSNCQVHLHMSLTCTTAKGAELDSAACQAKGRHCSCVVWGWFLYNIVESESDPLTFSKKNPSRAIPRSTYTHPPSLAKIRQRTFEEIGNTHTNAARIIVWYMMMIYYDIWYIGSFFKLKIMISHIRVPPALWLHTSKR